MTVVNTVLLGLLMGIFFGFFLEKSKVFEPSIIIGQFQLRKFTMLKVFLSAIIVGLVVFSVFFLIGYDRLNWKTTIYAADIIGGLLLGAGIAVAGCCPGTLFAQIGVGYKDSFATFFGAVLGAITFIKLKPWLQDHILNMGPQQRYTFDVLLNLPFYGAALLFIVILSVSLFAIEKHFPWRKELD